MVWLTQCGSKRHPWNFQSILCKNKGCLGSVCNTSHFYHTNFFLLCQQKGILGALWVEKIFKHTIVCKQPSRTYLDENNLKAETKALRKAPSADFLLLFTPNKACVTTLKSLSFFGLNPLCRKSMQMLYVAPLSQEAALASKLFSVWLTRQTIYACHRAQPSNSTSFTALTVSSLACHCL